ncbi:hypothetical protein M758_11G018000 [Ceratodon purpureus]|nr:hypothetical protein M758_11G018000 [Ceratodon purpureus]
MSQSCLWASLGFLQLRFFAWMDSELPKLFKGRWRMREVLHETDSVYRKGGGQYQI